MASTRISYTQELAQIDETLLRMGAKVRRMVGDSVASTIEFNIDVVDDILTTDDSVDSMEEQIEARCLTLLALQNPVARDLRRVSSAMKVAAELERVGDHAVDIAKYARKLHMEYLLDRPLVDIKRMAVSVERMLDESLVAFTKHDVELVKKVCADDDIVDSDYKAARDQLIAMVESNRSSVAGATFTMLIASALERIADHATNIAERVAYLETGQLQAHSRDLFGHYRAINDDLDSAT